MYIIVIRCNHFITLNTEIALEISRTRSYLSALYCGKKAPTAPKKITLVLISFFLYPKSIQAQYTYIDGEIIFYFHHFLKIIYLMVDHFVEEFQMKYGKNLFTDKVALNRLRAACTMAKESLSSASCATLVLFSLMDGIDFKSIITKGDFEALNADVFSYIFENVDEVIEDAGFTKSQIDDIVLFGGLQEVFNGKEPNSSIEPEKAAVYRAAVLKDFHLSEVVSLSLGVGFPVTFTSVLSLNGKRSFLPGNMTNSLKGCSGEPV